MKDTDPIVLVEDNEDDIVLTRRALARNKIGNPLVIARDGAEALELLLGANGDAVKPALVLLDLQLPKVDGLTVLKRLRDDPRTTLTPVVVLTSSKAEQDVVAGYNLRANSYIRKPVDFDQFTEAVRQIGMYWLLLNEPPPGSVTTSGPHAAPRAPPRGLRATTRSSSSSELRRGGYELEFERVETADCVRGGPRPRRLGPRLRRLCASRLQRPRGA